MYSSYCQVYITSDRTPIHAPKLEKLYLREIILKNNSGIKKISTISVLRIFDVPQLKFLDLSSNKIKRIDVEDAWRFSNLTYLDLSDNLLTSLSNLNKLYNVKVLLLGRNLQLDAVPTSIISNKVLQVLDLHDNRFVCNCSIERFQKWVLTDDFTRLLNGNSNGDRRGGRKRLPKFKFSAKFPIGLHVILQIQIKKFENDCYLL